MNNLNIDFDAATVTVQDGDGSRILPLQSAQAFDCVSAAWLRAGWDTKYVYSFTWLGRPIIQLPDDMIRIQEVVHQVQPDVIVETGIAHGGSLVFFASLCKSMERGRVVGVDVEIRPHNRKAIEEHPLFPFITLIEGDSVHPDVVSQVLAQVKQDEKVLVILDSNHTKEHVLAELRAYACLVSEGSWIVACDGIMGVLEGAPRSAPGWAEDNPVTAVTQFLAENAEFELAEPEWLFNEGLTTERVTYWPKAFVRRRSGSSAS